MRLLAVGDLHGCMTALSALEEFVPFGDDDLIVALGDFVDRGPNTREVVEWVLRRTDQRLCAPLRGNHEIMMLEAMQGHVPLREWLQFGGDAVLESYAEHGPGRPEDITLEHLQFLSHELLPWFETPKHIFVHAGLDPGLPMAHQGDEHLYWERFERMQPHFSGKRIICGHTAQKSGVPLDKGFAVCIDTFAYGGGWLTCLDVKTGQYWQANEKGQTRTEWLPSARAAATVSKPAAAMRPQSKIASAESEATEEKNQPARTSLSSLTDWLEDDPPHTR